MALKARAVSASRSFSRLNVPYVVAARVSFNCLTPAAIPSCWGFCSFFECTHVHIYIYIYLFCAWLCVRSPITAALLSEHANRIEAHRFSKQEIRWGQQVRTPFTYVHFRLLRATDVVPAMERNYKLPAWPVNSIDCSH